ncbi:hypothetical protein LINPERPRIM_LOCUS37888 [Linum perenne]
MIFGQRLRTSSRLWVTIMEGSRRMIMNLLLAKTDLKQVKKKWKGWRRRKKKQSGGRGRDAFNQRKQLPTLCGVFVSSSPLFLFVGGTLLFIGKNQTWRASNKTNMIFYLLTFIVVILSKVKLKIV